MTGVSLIELPSLHLQTFWKSDKLDRVPTILEQMGFLCRGQSPGEYKQIYRKRPWVGKDSQSVRQDEQAQELRLGEERQGAIKGTSWSS